MAINRRIVNGTLESGGALTPGWINNIIIMNATTTNANDSIKITGVGGVALSATNPGYVTFHGAAGTGLVSFQITADVTIRVDTAHFGIGTTGNITGVLLRVLAINDNGTLKWGVAYLGGRYTLLTTDTNATATNITAPEHVLCTSAISSSTNFCFEIGFARSDFNDTGDLWTMQTGPGDIVTGKTADGLFQNWNAVYSGYSADPVGIFRFTQNGRDIHVIGVISGNGTSNATTKTVSLPAKAMRAEYHVAVDGRDNSANLTTNPRADTRAGSVTCDLYKDASGAAWTNSGTSRFGIDFFYQVGPSASFID